MNHALRDRRVHVAALALTVTALVGRFLDPIAGILVLVGVVPGLVNAPRAGHYDSSLHLAALPATLGTIGYGLGVAVIRFTGVFETSMQAPTPTPLHLAFDVLGPLIEVVVWGPLWVIQAIVAFVVVRRVIRE